MYSSRRKQPINKQDGVLDGDNCDKNKEKVGRFLLHIWYQRRVMMFEQTSKENEGVSHFEQSEVLKLLRSKE